MSEKITVPSKCQKQHTQPHNFIIIIIIIINFLCFYVYVLVLYVFYTNFILCYDFRLLPRNRWELHSSTVLCNKQW